MIMLQRECNVSSPSEITEAFRHQLELLRLKAKQPGLLNLAAVVDVSGPLAAPNFNPRLRTVPGNLARGLISNALAPGAALLLPFRNRAKIDALCTQGLPVEPLG